MSVSIAKMTARILVVYLSVFAACTSAAEPGAKPAGKAAADWVASRPVSSTILLQIDTEQTGIRLIDAQVAAAVCASSAVVDPALEAALKLDPARARTMVVVSAKATGDSFVSLEVQVSDPGNELPSDAGPRVIAELVKRAAGTLIASADARLKPLRERREALLKRLMGEEEKLAAIEAERATLDPAPASWNTRAAFDVSASTAIELTRQRNALSLTLVELKARAEATKGMLSDAPTPTTRPAEGSAVELARRLADSRRKALAAAMESAGSGQPTQELDAIQSRWLEAELLVRLLNATEQRPTLNDGRQSLPNLQIEIAAQQAKLDELDRQIAKLPAASTQPSSLANRVDPAAIMDRLNQQRQRVQQVRSEIDNFDRQYASLRTPTILPLKAEGNTP